MSRSSQLERWLGLGSLLLALSASFVWLGVSGGDGATLPNEIGSSAYAWVALPVLFAGLPVIVPGRRHPATVVSAWLLLAFCVITGFTIGLLYWPAFMIMVLAAYAGARARRRG